MQPKGKVLSPLRKGSNPSANEIASKLSLKEAHRGSRKSQISEATNVEVVAEHPGEDVYDSSPTPMIGELR